MTTNAPQPEDLLDSDELTTFEVGLQMDFEAEDQFDAISRYIAEVARRGFDDFTFRVRNARTGEVWFVQQGQLYSMADFLALMAEDEADAG